MLIAQIIDACRKRDDFMRGQNAIILRMRAICRRRVHLWLDEVKDESDEKRRKRVKDEADKLYSAIWSGKPHPLAAETAAYLESFMVAHDALQETRKKYEKEMRGLAHQLPVWPWVKSIKGFGDLGLAEVIGATGDLANYENPAKVWKRMGLHVYKGKALYVKRSGMSSDDWIEAGYNPHNRSIMWTIVNLGIGTKESVYRQLRDARKEYERQKAEASGIKVVPSAKIPKKAKGGEYMSVGHVLNRANRYVAKRLLLDLWKEWNKNSITEGSDEPESYPMAALESGG